MIRTKQPPRGTFDWLLAPLKDEVPRADPPSPSPPIEPGRRPQQVRIDIEIVDRRGASQKGASGLSTLAGSIWAAIIAAALLALLGGCQAHAQPTRWQSYKEGFVTRYQGTDNRGQTWTGQSYQQGFTSYTEIQGPRGQMRHCRSWRQGFNIITECD